MSDLSGAVQGLATGLNQYLGTQFQAQAQDARDKQKNIEGEERDAAKQQAEMGRQQTLQKQKVGLEDVLTPDMAETALPGHGSKMVTDYNAAHPDNPLKLKDGIEYLKTAADSLNPDKTKEDNHQDTLEKTYADRRAKILSNRSGGLGLTDGKVDQARQLRSLLNQYYDPESGSFNVPPSQHSELAIGYARLLSGNGQISTEMENQLRQKTAKEGLAGALIWLGADPKAVGGATHSVMKMFQESIDRQGLEAESQRNHYEQGLKDLAPTSLDPKRKASVDKASLSNSFSDMLNQSPDKQKHFDSHPVGKVLVVNPEGKRGFVKASQLDDALKMGYKQAQ